MCTCTLLYVLYNNIIKKYIIYIYSNNKNNKKIYNIYFFKSIFVCFIYVIYAFNSHDTNIQDRNE